MKKRSCHVLISGIISLIMLVSIPINACAIPAFVDDIPGPINGNTLEFGEDAPWFSEAVYHLWYAHIVDAAEAIDETGFVLYGPSRDITREQFLGFLGRLADECGKEVVAVPSGREATLDDYTQWALENHILYGKGNSLAKKDVLTRQEMVVFIMRFAKYMELEMEESNTVGDYAKFFDSGHVSPWADESMKKAFRFNLIAGEKNRDGQYSLSPQRSVTCAEAAQAVYNYVEAAHIILPDYSGDVADEERYPLTD